MGGFGVKHYDGGHYFSVPSPEDLSVSRVLSLPFDDGEYVCGGLLYFHGEKGRIYIISLTTDEEMIVPPPNFNPPPYEGELRASGLGYDAKSGDYKLIRHYVQDYFVNEDGRDRFCDYKEFFELYQFKSFGLWKEPRRPRCTTVYDATGVYLGETGSCYWVGCNDSSVEEHLECLTRHAQLLQESSRFDGSLDSLFMHVVSFDFATERFGRLPLPASAIGLNLRYKLVKYYGSLGALVYDSTCSKMPVELFVWKGKGKGKGRSWEREYGGVYLDAEIPVGLKDDFLFFEAKPSGGHTQAQLIIMVYDFSTQQVKELDIYSYPRQMSVFSYGTESTDPPLPNSIPKANYDFSRKMRKRNKTRKGKEKKKTRKGKGKKKTRKGKGKKSCR